LTKASTGFVSWNPGYSSTTNHYTCTGCTNDSNGNVTNDGTNAYTWNEFSKMASINKSGTGCSTGGSCLIYDAFGNVVELDSGATKTEIWYTQVGKTAFMNGTTKNYIRFPAPGGGTIAIPATGGQYYMHKDWLGNARITSGISGQSIITDRAYAPYGEVYDIFDNTSTNYTMFGGDSTQDVIGGMYDTPNRELQGSQQGRWLSPDPAGAGWNQYAYTTNPNSGIDPTGLSTWIGNPHGTLGSGNPGWAGTGAGFFGGATPQVGNWYWDSVSGWQMSQQATAADFGYGNSASGGTLNMDFSAGAAMLAALFQGGVAEGGPEEKPESENLDPLNPLEEGETEWERNTELNIGPIPESWRFNLLEPGPLDLAIAKNFAGGQYTPMTVGGEGWSFDALYRVFGGDAEETGHWYSPLPQVGGLQSQIDLGLRPEWNNTATNAVCVYLPPGTQVYVGPIAAQTGYSPTVPGSGQSLGGIGIQVYVP
jgi:RHS repeat-associated protein